MKIVCLAMMDNGNYMRHAARGFRDYCHVQATAYVQATDTYVNIPDTTVVRWNGRDIPDADFYLTNDVTYFQHYLHLKDRPRLVKCNGTYARDMGGWFMWDYLKHGTHYLSSPCDYTLARALPFTIQTTGPLYDYRLLPAPDFDGPLTVGHAPTNAFKGTKTILQALNKYRKAGTIDIDVITQTRWTDAIQRKARCQVFIDQAPPDGPHYTKQGLRVSPSRGAFGINAVESLALGSIVLNEPLHPYVTQHYGYVPIYAFPKDLAGALSSSHTPNRASNIDWARRHFDISTQTPKLKEWIDYLCSPAY